LQAICELLNVTCFITLVGTKKFQLAQPVILDFSPDDNLDAELAIISLAHATEQRSLAVLCLRAEIALFCINELPLPI
jgi:hypothetical protein